MMIEIDDDTFCGLLVAKLKEDFEDAYRSLEWHTKHGHVDDVEFYKMLIKSYEGVLQYYMCQTDAVKFADQLRNQYADRT